MTQPTLFYCIVIMLYAQSNFPININFSVFASSPPAIGDTSLSAVTIVWNYVGELVFNLLVLVGAVKASDRIVKEIMGL